MRKSRLYCAEYFLKYGRVAWNFLNSLTSVAFRTYLASFRYLRITVLPKAVKKIKSTPELKNVSTLQQRYEILKDAFEVIDVSIRGKTVLLLDDLYRSGATLRALTEVLYKQGGVKNVKVLVLTKTKTG